MYERQPSSYRCNLSFPVQLEVIRNLARRLGASAKAAWGRTNADAPTRLELFVKSASRDKQVEELSRLQNHISNMEQPTDFKSMQDAIQAALIATTRSVGAISASDIGFQRSLNPATGEALDEQTARLLNISSSILKTAAALTESDVPVLEEVDDVDNNWKRVVDVVDSLLERADMSLDEYTGLIKRKGPDGAEPYTSKARKQGNPFRNQNLVKPQLAFEHKPNNNPTEPWKPLLKTKPHAIVPLEKSLVTFQNEYGRTQYKHPYETEIRELAYPKAVYTIAESIPYQPVEITTATFVDTYEGVLEMLKELKQAKEIAVDLEHHDQRSYIGLVSLMQISTREKDWIVDTLKPWREDLQVLNEAFADPKIVKVFHGAFMDIVWLQRDLGLYINGLFDTNAACKALGYPGGSLAYLLKRFVDFDADKKYQMADWRIRPIPEEMLFYARADTHFLLYIYDHVRNELVEKSNPKVPDGDRMGQVLRKSKETSLFRYESAVYDAETGRGPGGWFATLTRTPVLFSHEQFAVFRAIHAFRDKVARQDDDSTNYVMPNHVVMSLSKLMPLNMQPLLAALHPVSHSIKARAGELLDIIRAAKEDGKDGPSMMDVLKPDSVGAIASANAREARAAAARQALPATTLSAVINNGLRSDKSTFWGGAFGSSTWDKPATLTKPGADIQLAIPLPPISANAFLENATVKEEEPEMVKGEPETDFTPLEEPFTIKQGKKRKAEEPTPEPEAEEDTPMADGEYDITLNQDAQEKKKEKAKRRAEKKAAKLAKRITAGEVIGETATKKQVEDAEKEEEEEGPFDYSKADSVMNKKKGAPQHKDKKQKNKPFDPYQKSADAPKGMRRLQTERPGKSFTFKR